jgi:glycosyltransferase involved in cell wall biosynthesis
VTTHVSSHVGWRKAVRRFGSVVCASTADFDAPLWTNKQHLMSRVAAEIPVLYIESLGLRHPRPTRRDAARIARRLRPGRSGGMPASVRELEIASPLVLPYHGSRIVRAVNHGLLERQLHGRIARLPRPRLLWAYSPAVIDELDLTQFETVVYHAVDDLASVPGIPRTVAALERRLAERADAVAASADALASRLSRFNSNTHLVGQAADIDHFGLALAGPDEPSDVIDLPRPRAIFVGALSDHKVDWSLFADVVRRLPTWSFIVIGPVGGEAGTQGWRKVASLANGYVLDHRPYRSLPAYLGAADVGIIPYVLTEHTAGIWPLKLVEYLAAGLSVVATPLDSLRRELPVALASDADSFAAALVAADRSELGRQARHRAVADHSWDALLDRIFAVVLRDVEVAA